MRARRGPSSDGACLIPGRLGSINDADDQFRRDGTDDCTEDDGEGIALDEQRSNSTRDAKPSIGSHRNPPSDAASLIPVRIGLTDNGDDRSGAGYCAEREGEGTASGEVSLDLVAATKDTEGRYSALEPVGKGHLRLTPYLVHPNTVGYPDPFWNDVPKIVVLSQQQWEDFDQTRILRQRERIAKVDWASNIPCEETKRKRLPLPLMGKIPTAYPSYRDILSDQLGGESYSSMAASEERTDGSGVFTDGTAAGGPVDCTPDVQSPKKKKKKNKSSKEAVNQKEILGVKRKRVQKELAGRSTDGGEELFTSLAIARKNLLVLEYESALRKMASDLAKAEMAIKTKDVDLEKTKKEVLDKAKELITEQNCYHRERKQAIKTAEALEDELETARSKIARLEEEKISEAEKMKREMGRLS
ncbi:hypothetical protein Bca52824_087189 [Brassica carinata]|uniref:Uncharacterized protein n=1 Tax=Brassica carinata TaxID=52824 RepID=A0A8X7TNE0_BRACI|nr:hypothetical protein Bca52824_087189 [Brassica carinata]